MKKLVSGALACMLVLLAGCHKKDIQSTEAVRQGVIEYLSKRPDLSAMEVTVQSASFRKDEATATVYFQAKGGAPGAGMQMQYVLERRGDKWVVKGRAGMSSGTNPHGGTVPPGMGSGDNPHGGGTPALPPGHPPIPEPPRQ